MLATVPRRINTFGSETYNAHDMHALLREQLEKNTADLRAWEERLISQSEACGKTITLARQCLDEEQKQFDELTNALQKIWDLQMGKHVPFMRHYETEPERFPPSTPEDSHLHDECMSVCDEAPIS